MNDVPTGPTTSGWREHPRYPDPAVVSLDPSFDQFTIKLAFFYSINR